jgi:hypothetical protein
MRKLAIAVVFAALTTNAALACDEHEKVETAQQTEQKPAVAEKVQKQNKQVRKTKKADRADKTTVARADR